MFFKSKKEENPFHIKPNSELVGVEDEKNKLVEYIKGKDICFLNGPPGVGKSSLLEWVKTNLKEHSVIYLDAKELDEHFDLKRCIKEHTPFWKSLLRIPLKDVVILLDEAQACDPSIIELLEAYWNKNIIKSIVVAQIKPHLVNYPESFKNRLGKRTLNLDKLDLIETHNLIKLRTKGKNPFANEALNLIVEKADHIPRKILENCRVVLVETGKKEKISANDVKQVFDKLEERELGEEVLELEDGKVNDNALISLEKVDGVESISPMEKRIVKLLLDGGKTNRQLAKILNTSIGSIGKQLSNLVSVNFVEVVNPRRPKVYGLSKSFKENLKKEA